MSNELENKISEGTMSGIPPSTVYVYGHMTKGGEMKVNLSQEEACVVLKAYDDGIDHLSSADLAALNSLIGKLKDVIWP